MSFCIRAMQAEDLDGVLALVAASAEAPLWSRNDYEEVLSPGPGARLVSAPWVAHVDGELVGFAVARWLRGESTAEIENLLVERQHRRQGIGAALIKACIAWAAHAGALTVRLEVRASNAAALSLYCAQGFVPAGVRRAYYVLPVEDACILEVPARARN